MGRPKDDDELKKVHYDADRERAITEAHKRERERQALDEERKRQGTGKDDENKKTDDSKRGGPPR